MNPSGWQTRHDPDWHGPDKWIASNDETGVTVFARDLGELVGEIVNPTTDVRWQMQAGCL